jgi:hypothetical protein
MAASYLRVAWLVLSFALQGTKALPWKAADEPVAETTAAGCRAVAPRMAGRTRVEV